MFFHHFYHKNMLLYRYKLINKVAFPVFLLKKSSRSQFNSPVLVVDWNGAAARASTTAIGVPNLREQYVHVTKMIFGLKMMTSEGLSEWKKGCVSNEQRRKHVETCNILWHHATNCSVLSWALAWWRKRMPSQTLAGCSIQPSWCHHASSCCETAWQWGKSIGKSNLLSGLIRDLSNVFHCHVNCAKVHITWICFDLSWRSWLNKF